MTQWRTMLGGALVAMTYAAWAAGNTDLPVDAPADAIMASPAEVQNMGDWAKAAFLGETRQDAEK